MARIVCLFKGHRWAADWTCARHYCLRCSELVACDTMWKVKRVHSIGL